MNNINNNIDIIKEYFDNLKQFVSENKLQIIGVLVIICILVITYLYSANYRTKRKISYILNSFNYDKERKQLDFCGGDNNLIDTLYLVKCNVDFDQNTLEIKNPKINLFDIGLSSEFMIDIKNSSSDGSATNIDGSYKIEKIEDASKIKFDTLLKKSDDTNYDSDTKNPTYSALVGGGDQNYTSITITYYRPNSNINEYKYRKLTDYNIASSYRSFLIGSQRLDYCSADMINRVLYLGARYVELEIFNKNIKNDTIPIVTTGYSLGSIKLQINHVKFEDCIDMIAKTAFSEAHLNNFKDPLFLFLNLKVNGNVNTLNKVAGIIKTKMSNRLLHKKYLNSNMGDVTLCDLQSKCVIFSSEGWKGSDLADLVNSATDTPYLKRLTHHEIMNYSERSKPKCSISSNNIYFKKGSINSSLSIRDSNIDLFSKGIIAGDNVIIKGADNEENNSGSYLFKVSNVSKDSLSFDKSVIFKFEEPGNMINIDVYDASYTGNHESLVEYNKNNLTICIPDDKHSSLNYNFNEGFYKGCQFVTMNYQSVDKYMKDYFNYFSEHSFKFKISSLVHTVNLPKVESLRSMVPKDKKNLKYDVDYSFFQNINKTITLNSIDYDRLKIGYDENSKASILLDGLKDNTQFVVERGNDKTNDTISLRLKNDILDGKRYLKFNKNCCYLSIDKFDENNDENNDEYNRDTSFIPLKPLFKDGNKKTNSFAVKMRKQINGESQEVLYYLKYFKNFSPKSKLFIKKTGDTQLKTKLPTDKEIRTPIIDNEGFLPLGDIITTGPVTTTVPDTTSASATTTDPDTTTDIIMVNGDVAHPEDYELIFDNRNGDIPISRKFSIWKPIAPEGYTALGYVAQNSYKKPSRNKIYTVSNIYIKEEDYDESFYESKYKSKDILSLWSKNVMSDDNKENKENKKHYFIALQYVPEPEQPSVSNKLQPSVFDHPHFVIDMNNKRYKDRIYLDHNLEDDKQDKKSATFIVDVEIESPPKGGRNYKNLLNIEDRDSKLVSFTRSEGGGPLCMGLPQSFNSSYLKVGEGTDTRPQSRLNALNCGDSYTSGTNFRVHNDYSIRLADSNDFCVTHRTNDNIVNKDINDEENYLYLDKCDINLKNQKFLATDSKIQVFDDGGAESNACITHTPDNKLRLEMCGDQKYTALYLWNDNIYREDKCFQEEADNVLKEVGAMEKCVDNSYYVLYMDGIIKNKEFCSLKEANTYYSEISNKYPGGVVVGYKNEFFKQTFTGDVPTHFVNELKNLASKKGACYFCENPSKMLCSKQRMEESFYNSFNNFKEEQRLMKYCMKMKDIDDFRCGRANRQKFIKFPMPEDYCLNINKNIFYRVEVRRQHKEPQSSQNQFPVQNLLGENVDTKNYIIFLKSMIVKMKSFNEIVIIDTEHTNSEETTTKSLTEDDICLDYKPKEYMIKVGTKVLVEWQSFKHTNLETPIKKENVRYLGVVIKKISKNKYRVMLSINGYEIDRDKEPLSGNNHYTSNPIVDRELKELVLYKKADMCLTE